MSDLKRHRISVRAITEYESNGLSTNPKYYTDNLAVARRYWLDWWDHRPGPEPEILTITVDGETFTIEQIRSYKGGHE